MKALALFVVMFLPALSWSSRAGVARRWLVGKVNSHERLRSDYYAHLKPQHRTVLRAWLRNRPYLRPATEEEDSVFKNDLKSIRQGIGKDANQYYSVGDFNRDGKEDFAVLLADRRNVEDGFALAVFNGPFHKKQYPAYYEEKFDSISNTYLVFNGVVKNHLFLGVFESDWYCMTLIPKGRRYSYKDCNR